MFIAEISGWVSKIMYELIKSITYANKGQFIIVNAGYKRILAENLGIKPQSVTNAINDLVKKGILT
ncbi:helix-turn-helix domain-containing protein, partial [Xenorhabdus doucetiae]|uniref:helix-turn-helix domain-containing protein n=1 Tax=Xenorhabdus doucetiae TaxID=351671 RepID=UPI002B40AE8A